MDIKIDPRTSRWRPDLRCNSPHCSHSGRVVELFGRIRERYWCTECGLISTRENDFRIRSGTLPSLLIAKYG